MRFAKFFIALLFGAVFLLTLFKVLVFMLMAALVVGTIFLASRAFGYRRFRHMQQWPRQYGPHPYAEPFGQQQSPFEQPLNPNWQARQHAPAFGRRIEVL
jgi:hypothetical protein